MPADVMEYEVQLPFGPPPVLPDVQKQLREYLLCPDRLPIHDFKEAQKFWPRDPDPKSLYHVDVTPLGTTLKVDRDPTTGELLQFREVPIDNMGCTSKNSLSLQRAPGPLSEAVRGSATNYPFWPGGFSDLLQTAETEEQDIEIDFVNNLLSLPPGFEKGLKFKADGKTPIREDIVENEPVSVTEEVPESDTATVNLVSIIKQEEDLLGLWQDTKQHKKEEVPLQKFEVVVDEGDAAEVIPKEYSIPVLNISKASQYTGLNKTETAEMLDSISPVKDFEKKIPDMAKTWSFKLDPFQQQAILKLEENCNVFVAAHTSAGKTVVAEYAIALSQKHMTRAIYTSPVKALSNQKYRDFRETFVDVGLITGDFQINETAQCLIMTTEILRSMLYCGSEVIRDLEYVIFDEVHYINDAERGHVWEEVLILLPDHVRIVMLSATVPNVLELASWVGAIKKKKVYVVSTEKRPVPLEHYLYTGCDKRTANQLFRIINSKGEFLRDGCECATKAKEAQLSKHKPGTFSKKGAFAATSSRQVMKQENTNFVPKKNEQQEGKLLMTLLNELKDKDKLPVIAFTLSKKRCDRNSKSLQNLDLTTKKEKSIILMFFKASIEHLKPPDRLLPQVALLQRLLRQGIGIHHSGILPILKEIVEMLFQRGFVKLLFATETFAMGVNMPARTVVFDSIQKYDGKEWRHLLPAEYIQMAGRAGRRGNDTTGTVIIVCKNEVPPMLDLRSMMTGKPTQVDSKFRVTYSIILNLYRVEQISVKGMLSHSFKEYPVLKKKSGFEKELSHVEKKLQEKSVQEHTQGQHWKAMCNFYDMSKEYLELKTRIYSTLIKSKAIKTLTPGRVLLITCNKHINKVGILLSVDIVRGKEKFKVLILCNTECQEPSAEIELSVTSSNESSVKEYSPLWYKINGLHSRDKIFIPDGLGGHAVLTVQIEDIVKFVDHTMKIDPDLIIKDWEQRQIPRFSDYPPGKSCSEAIQKLTEFIHGIATESEKLRFVNLIVTDIEVIDEMESLRILEKKLKEFNDTNIANFEELFAPVFEYKELEREKDKLIYNMSPNSLDPEYKARENVLLHLKYIDDKHQVKLKGRVACEMGSHELMISEMVLRNIFNDMQPAEIAALLSCLVFQQNFQDEDIIKGLTKSLQDGIKKIKKIGEDIMDVEKMFDADPSFEYNKLNFGLVQVVYEWARKKSFSQIMEFAKVEEGVIVRCIQQLNETLRDVRNAAHLIGSSTLKEKMQEASDAIKRDIVFAASLYTSEDTHHLKVFEMEDFPEGDE